MNKPARTDEARSQTLSGRFIEALRELETSRTLDPLVQLFAADAALESMARSDSGPEAGKKFWMRYRDQFDDIRSTFSQVIEADGVTVLIWRSQGRLVGGRPITYDGVSVLSFDNDRITHFQTFYDSAAFNPTVASSSPSD